MFILTAFQILNPFIFLNLDNILQAPFLIYTIFTATIIPTVYNGFMSLLSLLFTMIMIFFAGRNIEMRFGRKILLSIYFIGTFITGGVIILLQLLLTLFISPEWSIYMYYSSMGGVLALITFMGLLSPETQVTLVLYFIPVRLKMKQIVLIFIFFEILNLVIVYFVNGIVSPFISAPANIAGCLGGYIMLKSVRQRSRPRFT